MTARPLMMGEMMEYPSAVSERMVNPSVCKKRNENVLMTTRSVILGNNVPHATLGRLYLICQTDLGVDPSKNNLT